MNSITVAGQLGKDAEMRHLQDGTPVLSFSVADSQGRDKPTIWWRCSFFGKRAEAVAPYLLKGQAVTVVGVASEREWEKDGQKQKSLELRVNDVALQGGKREGTIPTKTADGRVAHMPRQTSSAGMDDDIPFADPYRGRAFLSL